ncbi:MAG TPA: TolC family protein [Vicinamibacterales bacterium]|nr:TolC family protein [Vicinamibacterales bacterium]
MISTHIIRRTMAAAFCATLMSPVLSSPVWGQSRPSLPSNSPFAGGVPEGMAVRESLSLSIADAIERALRHNLGVLLSEQGTARAAGTRMEALSHLLPNVTGRVSESRRKSNLEAFGFPLSGQFPRIVGPFNVFDARVFLSQAVLDLSALNEVREEGHNLAAARHSYRSARDLVVLVAANLYLQTLAAGARADSARAQRDTADALHRQADSLRQNGLVAGIDVVRAEVRLSTERQRATAAENDFQKSKLQLARVIGLPLGQTFVLGDDIPIVPAPEMTVDQALERAYKTRPDYLAALERVQAAESARRAVSSEALPSVRVTADYGAIGLTASTALPTFNLTGTIDVPIFEGGRLQGRRAQADADLRERRAEAEDVRSEIYYDVQTAFLDVKATEEELQTATRARELAALQLTQSRDRFAAGVVSNIEVVQSQEAVALASEQYINAQYSFNLAKAMLARSLGTAEEAVRQYLGSSNNR